MNTLVIVSSNGDDRLNWMPNDPESVAIATRTFDDLVRRGYLASEMTSATEGQQIRQFNPNAQEIVLSPAVVAG